MMEQPVSEGFCLKVLLTERVLGNFCRGVMRLKLQDKPWETLKSKKGDLLNSISWSWRGNPNSNVKFFQKDKLTDFRLHYRTELLKLSASG